MSDVREQLINALGDMRAHVLAQRSSIELADAILARFEVTEKPVVTAEELGRMAKWSAHDGSLVGLSDRDRTIGVGLASRLAAVGLTIVRSGETER